MALSATISINLIDVQDNHLDVFSSLFVVDRPLLGLYYDITHSTFDEAL